MTTATRRDATDALIAIERRVEQLAARVATLEAGQRRRTLPACDDWSFLHALVTALPGRAFTARDVIVTAADDHTLHAVVGGAGARRVGARLRQLRDRPVNGFVLVGVKRDGSGDVYAVKQALDRVDG